LRSAQPIADLGIGHHRDIGLAVLVAPLAEEQAFGLDYGVALLWRVGVLADPVAAA
jgi:hypothetical protein